MTGAAAEPAVLLIEAVALGKTVKAFERPLENPLS